jgi:hypothetical protein
MILIVKQQASEGDAALLWGFDVSHIRHCFGSANEIEALWAIVFGSSDAVGLWTSLATEIRLDYKLPKSSMSSDFREAPV